MADLRQLLIKSQIIILYGIICSPNVVTIVLLFIVKPTKTLYG